MSVSNRVPGEPPVNERGLKLRPSRAWDYRPGNAHDSGNILRILSAAFFAARSVRRPRWKDDSGHQLQLFAGIAEMRKATIGRTNELIVEPNPHTQTPREIDVDTSARLYRKVRFRSAPKERISV